MVYSDCPKGKDEKRKKRFYPLSEREKTLPDRAQKKSFWFILTGLIGKSRS